MGDGEVVNAMGQSIVDAMRFQKVFGLYGVEHCKVEKWSGLLGSGWVWWVMGQWSVGQWIVGVICFQKIFGLFGLKHHIVEMSPMRDGRTNKQQAKIELLSF